jgi:hypothetical protein
MLCDRLPELVCRQARLDGLQRLSGRKQTLRGELHPIDHLVAGPSESVDLGKAGRPARTENHPRHLEEVTPVD